MRRFLAGGALSCSADDSRLRFRSFRVPVPTHVLYIAISAWLSGLSTVVGGVSRFVGLYGSVLRGGGGGGAITGDTDGKAKLGDTEREGDGAVKRDEDVVGLGSSSESGSGGACLRNGWAKPSLLSPSSSEGCRRCVKLDRRLERGRGSSSSTALSKADRFVARRVTDGEALGDGGRGCAKDVEIGNG